MKKIEFSLVKINGVSYPVDKKDIELFKEENLSDKAKESLNKTFYYFRRNKKEIHADNTILSISELEFIFKNENILKIRKEYNKEKYNLFYNKNKERIDSYQAEYRRKNEEKRKEWDKKSYSNYKNKITFVYKVYKRSVKNFNKRNNTNQPIYSLEELKSHFKELLTTNPDHNISISRKSRKSGFMLENLCIRKQIKD